VVKWSWLCCRHHALPQPGTASQGVGRGAGGQERQLLRDGCPQHEPPRRPVRPGVGLRVGGAHAGQEEVRGGDDQGAQTRSNPKPYAPPSVPWGWGRGCWKAPAAGMPVELYLGVGVVVVGRPPLLACRWNCTLGLGLWLLEGPRCWHAGETVPWGWGRGCWKAPAAGMPVKLAAEAYLVKPVCVREREVEIHFKVPTFLCGNT